MSAPEDQSLGLWRPYKCSTMRGFLQQQLQAKSSAFVYRASGSLHAQELHELRCNSRLIPPSVGETLLYSSQSGTASSESHLTATLLQTELKIGRIAMLQWCAAPWRHFCKTTNCAQGGERRPCWIRRTCTSTAPACWSWRCKVRCAPPL